MLSLPIVVNKQSKFRQISVSYFLINHIHHLYTSLFIKFIMSAVNGMLHAFGLQLIFFVNKTDNFFPLQL